MIDIATNTVIANMPVGVSPIAFGNFIGAPLPTIASSKDQCKGGGCQLLVQADGTLFKNQGDCIQYVNTGK